MKSIIKRVKLNFEDDISEVDLKQVISEQSDILKDKLINQGITFDDKCEAMIMGDYLYLTFRIRPLGGNTIVN